MCHLYSGIRKYVYEIPNAHHDTKIKYKGTYVGVMSSLLLIKHLPIFWGGIYMARLVVRSGDQKDTCHDESGRCAHNIDTILGPVVNLLLV